HWDLPQALEDKGGWVNRDTSFRFADYAELLTREFGDLISTWVLLNEPGVFTYLGYGTGLHAPGRSSFLYYLRAAHNANIAQSLALNAMRAAAKRRLSLG